MRYLNKYNMYYFIFNMHYDEKFSYINQIMKRVRFVVKFNIKKRRKIFLVSLIDYRKVETPNVILIVVLGIYHLCAEISS